MNIPLSLSLALETPSYTQHQCQSQPLTAPVSSSPALAAPAESSPFYSLRRVNLCNTRPAQGQRQRQRQRRRQLSSQRTPPNKPGRRGGHFNLLSQTASHADNVPANLPSSAVDANPDAQRQRANPSVNSPTQQPGYPSVASPEPAAVRNQRRQPPGTRRNLLATRPPESLDFIPQSPFRSRVAAATASNSLYRLPRRFGPGRLWNPTNSTPRAPPSRTPRPSQPFRKRRPSTPPPPSVPVNHPAIEISSDPVEPIGFGAGDFPLLPLPEHSTRGSLHIEGRASGDKRISLPASVRHSYDGKRAPNPPPPQETEAGPSEPRPKFERPRITGLRKRGQSVTKRARAISFGLVRPETSESSPKKLDKGKGKAVMSQMANDDPVRSFSKDLERGPSVLGHRHNGSNASLPGGIGSAISSSDSSILGDPDQPDLGEEWGPQHPCYPHLNPHVPLNSPEYTNTRIIRIRRDWLVEGDLAPTFSNLYPEILDPAGVSEQEFRRVIEKLNAELIPIFNPYNWRNVLDGVLGLLTGWIWDDIGLTYAKTRLRGVESWIDKWNTEMEKAAGSEEGTIPPRIVSLRRTGYMNLDFQIPDPEIAPTSEPSGSRSGPNMPAEPNPAVLPESPIEA